MAAREEIMARLLPACGGDQEQAELVAQDVLRARRSAEILEGLDVGSIIRDVEEPRAQEANAGG